MSRTAGDVTSATSSAVEVWYIDLAGATTDSITISNSGIPKWASIVGGYLTGAVSGAATNTAEAQFGTLDHTGPGINLALTVPSTGIGLWGFLADGAAIGTGLTPVWTNMTSSSSDEYITQNTLTPNADVACNHSITSGSVDAIVAPTSGNGYDFICGMIAASWGAAPVSGDNLVGEMPMIQMKRKSLGWTPPLVDHRRRSWRKERSLFLPSNKLWTPRQKLAA